MSNMTIMFVISTLNNEKKKKILDLKFQYKTLI